jgi:hypothetical protein
MRFPSFPIEKKRCWGPIAVAIINRPAGKAICHNDCHRLTYFLSNFRATMQDDEGPEWKSDLLHDNFAFRPPDTTLQSNLTVGRYIQILQRNETYDQLASDMTPGGVAHLVPRYNLNDPLISQLVSSIANEIGEVFSTRSWLTPSIPRSPFRLCGYVVIRRQSRLSRRTDCRASD